MHEQRKPQIRAKDGFASAVFCGCSVNALSAHAVRTIVQRGFVVVEEIKCTKYLEEEVEPGELPKALTPHFSTLV